MAIQWNISPGGGSPIFKQIVDQVRLAVATGQLAAGEQLPSVRALAERLLVNPNTVARAYADLARDGILDGQQGRGVFIAPPRPVYTRTERLRRLAPLADAFINEGLSLGFSPSDILEALRRKLDGLDIPEVRRKSS
jgi:GntR family transcriptional regulator